MQTLTLPLTPTYVQSEPTCHDGGTSTIARNESIPEFIKLQNQKAPKPNSHSPLLLRRILWLSRPPCCCSHSHHISSSERNFSLNGSVMNSRAATDDELSHVQFELVIVIKRSGDNDNSTHTVQWLDERDNQQLIAKLGFTGMWRRTTSRRSLRIIDSNFLMNIITPKHSRPL